MYQNISIFLLFIYLFIQIFISKKDDYRIISVINSILTSSISNYLLIVDYNKYIEICDCKEEEVGELYLYPIEFIKAYILFDIYYSIYPLKKDMLIHGFLIFIGIYLLEYFNMRHCAVPGLLLETSTLYLNYMKESEIMSLLFLFTFIIYRIIIFPLLSINYLINKYEMIISLEINKYKILFIIISSFNILNMYWFIKILKIAKKKILKKLN